MQTDKTSVQTNKTLVQTDITRVQTDITRIQSDKTSMQTDKTCVLIDITNKKNWWGPNGFTNTIHKFDLQPCAKCILTMHGTEVGNYENSSIFKEVLPMKLVSWTRLSKPLFDMEVGFEKIDETRTQISFKMIFDSPESCHKVKKFALPKNEENFDRLVLELNQMA